MRKSDLGNLLFATIGLLLVDFAYLTICYEKRRSTLDAIERGDPTAHPLIVEGAALAVGGFGIFLALILVFSWVGASQRRAARTLAARARCLLRDSPSTRLQSSHQRSAMARRLVALTRNRQRAYVAAFLSYVLRMVILLLLCLHVIPMLQSAAVILEAYGAGRGH
jgi:hypothetical protein